MVRILISYSLLFLFNISHAQLTDAMLVGDVQSEGEHVPFATVQIKGTTIGTVTDHTGHYMFNNLPEGTYTITARAAGLKPKERRVTFNKDQTVEVKFILEPDPINLENIVVTATRTTQSRRESPVVVNTLEPKTFSFTQSVNLAEGLNFVPGLRTECNCENCGFNQTRINGLEGGYTQILINNRPVFSGLASVYGLEILPANMIERVETVRGGGSVLYSGNAVAGVVNLITKDPTDNSFSIDVNYRYQGVGYDKPKPDMNSSFNATVVSDDNKSGIALFGYYRNRDHFDANGDSFSEITAIENNTIGLKTFYRPTSWNKLTVDFLRFDEFRRGGNDFNLLPHEADIAEQVEHKITNLSATFDQCFRNKPSDLFSIYVSGQTVDRDSYYGAEQDPGAYGFSQDFSYILGTKYVFGYQFLGGNVLTLGIENIGNDLTDKKLGINQEPNSKINDQKINTTGSFIQNELKINKTKLLLGLRADRYEIINGISSEANNGDWVLVPRANVLHDVTSQLQLRLSYAHGYRAPQVFDEDLHIESSGARTVLHKNAPDLKRETSYSYTGSLNYHSSVGRTYFEVLAEGFYTDLQNAFISEFGVPDENGRVEYVRHNSEAGAVVKGVNLELNAALGTNITWQTGYTIQSAMYGEAEEEFGKKEFYRTPETYGFTVLSWQSPSKLELSLNGKYTGRMMVPHFTEESATLKSSQAFFDFGVRSNYTFRLSNETEMQLYLGMNNLFNSYQDDFDTGINRDPAYVYGPGLPRTLFFGVSFGR